MIEHNHLPPLSFELFKWIHVIEHELNVGFGIYGCLKWNWRRRNQKPQTKIYPHPLEHRLLHTSMAISQRRGQDIWTSQTRQFSSNDQAVRSSTFRSIQKPLSKIFQRNQRNYNHLLKSISFTIRQAKRMNMICDDPVLYSTAICF